MIKRLLFSTGCHFYWKEKKLNKKLEKLNIELFLLILLKFSIIFTIIAQVIWLRNDTLYISNDMKSCISKKIPVHNKKNSNIFLKETVILKKKEL